MKKEKVIIICISILLLLSACNGKKSENLKESISSSTITKTVNNIDMKIENIKTTESVSKDRNMVSIEMTFMNNDNAVVGIGATDFKLKSKGKTYVVYPQGNNFGDEFEPNSKLNGKAYFELPNTVKKATLVYAPIDKEEASWSIIIPEAK